MKYLEMTEAIGLIARYIRERHDADEAHRLLFAAPTTWEVTAAAERVADSMRQRADTTHRELIHRLMGDYEQKM